MPLGRWEVYGTHLFVLFCNCMSVCIFVGLLSNNLKSWINLNTFDHEGVSRGYEAPIISVKTNVQIRKDLMKIPICGKDGNRSSTH